MKFFTGAEDITEYRTYMVAAFEISEEKIACKANKAELCPGKWHNDDNTQYTSLKARIRLRLNFKISQLNQSATLVT